MTKPNPVILIIEDDVELARLNARLLKYHGYDVLVANTAAEARAVLKKSAPNLFVLDVSLPDGDGFTLCKEFRLDSDAPMIFLTGRTGTTDKVTGLCTCADYYLTKPFDSDEFIAVVQCLLRREEQNQKKIDEVSVITKGSLTLRIDERKALIMGRDAGLTLKEFAVLLILVQNEEKEVSSEVIYTSVWGATMNNDANAVRLTVSRLKKKLDEENAIDFAIFTKYGGGYVFSKM